MPHRSRKGRHRRPNEVDRPDLDDELLAARPVAPPPIVDRARGRISYTDARRWDPSSPRIDRDVAGRPARVIHGPRRQSRSAAAGTSLKPALKSRFKVGTHEAFRYETPRTVSTCAKRIIRREVLHALKKTTAGKGARKRRSWRSLISC